MEKQTTKQLIEDFAGKVARYRWEQKLTLEELANKAGVSSVLLSQVEKNNLENCSLKKLIDVANACELQLTITAEPVATA